MEGEQIKGMGGDQVVQLFTNWRPENLGLLGGEQILGVAAAMDGNHFQTLEASQFLSLTTGVGANDINALGSDGLSVIASNLDVEDLASLEEDLAGGIFGLVTDEAPSTFDDGRLEAALTALDADFFNAGASDFADLQSASTIFDLIELENPEALAALFSDQTTQDFFGGSLFGNN